MNLVRNGSALGRLPLVSIIVPAYNEEANLPALFARVGAVVDRLSDRCHFEIILLDNCSRDRTGAIAAAQCALDPRWKYVRYSRNFGAEGSLLAGLDFAEGDAAINLFSDLQDPPELIPQMLDEWEKGADVVYGVVRERNDSSQLKTLGAKIAYRLINVLADCNVRLLTTGLCASEESLRPT
jgi:glycosyltransferase involved in cell wall biosynthesis